MRLVYIFILFIIPLSSCKKEIPDILTAEIDGERFSANSFVFDIQDTLTAIVGSVGLHYISIALVNAVTPGIYDLGMASSSTGSYSNDDQATFFTSRSGNVFITEFGEERVKGTFDYIAVKASTQDTIEVSNGAFDISRE